MVFYIRVSIVLLILAEEFDFSCHFCVAWMRLLIVRKFQTEIVIGIHQDKHSLFLCNYQLNHSASFHWMDPRLYSVWILKSLDFAFCNGILIVQECENAPSIEKPIFSNIFFALTTCMIYSIKLATKFLLFQELCLQGNLTPSLHCICGNVKMPKTLIIWTLIVFQTGVSSKLLTWFLPLRSPFETSYFFGTFEEEYLISIHAVE